jgi:hypothetical protein
MHVWPNLFIVGAPKAGTTSLHEYVSQLPDVFMSPVKEPNFFSREIISDDNEISPIREEGKYLNLFRGAEVHQYKGEASPTYLLDRKAPELIRRVSPDARILVTIRDPVELIYSYYLMMYGRREITLPFSEAVKARIENQPIDWKQRQLRLEFAFYAESLERYFDVFGNEKVHVIIFEEMRADPQRQLDDVADFLNCTRAKLRGPEKLNRASTARSELALSLLRNRELTRIAEKVLSRKMRHFLREHLLMKPMERPPMEDSARQRLVRLYRDDVARVKMLLDRELPWPNFSDVN